MVPFYVAVSQLRINTLYEQHPTRSSYVCIYTMDVALIYDVYVQRKMW